jgi:hypothetical protein
MPFDYCWNFVLIRLPIISLRILPDHSPATSLALGILSLTYLSFHNHSHPPHLLPAPSLHSNLFQLLPSYPAQHSSIHPPSLVAPDFPNLFLLQYNPPNFFKVMKCVTLKGVQHLIYVHIRTLHKAGTG